MPVAWDGTVRPLTAETVRVAPNPSEHEVHVGLVGLEGDTCCCTGYQERPYAMNLG